MTESSYSQILKSSALIGGSTAVDILLRIARVKVLAFLLGPQGIGWLGLYTAIGQVGTSVAILGVETAAVRQVANANQSGQDVRLVSTLRSMWSVLLIAGAIVTALMALSAGHISSISFGTDMHRTGVIVVAASTLFGCIFAGLRATAQGLRRIADLALINIVGSVLSTVVVIAMVWVWGQAAVPSVVTVTAALSVGVACCVLRRRSGYPDLSSGKGSRQMALSLLQLGSVFLFSAVAGAAIAYFTRALVLRISGLDAAGHYQSASALAIMYTGIIVQAMGADYFPRLGGARDVTEVTRLANEQIEVGLMVALPGVLVTLALAPLIMTVFYSSAFMPAAEVLRWLVIGALLQVVSWPMGYILPAREDRRLFLATEVASVLSHFALIWAFVSLLGLRGAAIGYVIQNLAYCFFIYTVLRARVGFGLSSRNLRLIGTGAGAVLLLAAVRMYLPPWPAAALGVLAAACAGAYSLRTLGQVVGFENTRIGRRLTGWLGVRRSP